MSNILKAFVNYLSDEMGMRVYLEDVYKKLDLQNGVSGFYSFVTQHFPISKSYISSKYIKSFLKDPTQPESLLMVLKLALNRFYRVDFPLLLLKSTKIKKRSKIEQMKKSRELIECLFKK
jgi:hypothetical protein